MCSSTQICKSSWESLIVIIVILPPKELLALFTPCEGFFFVDKPCEWWYNAGRLEMIIMTWLFPKWENCAEDLIKIFDTIGIYLYPNEQLSKDNEKVMDIHLFNMKLVFELVPEEYRERFLMQYIWYKSVVLKDEYVAKVNQLIQKVRESDRSLTALNDIAEKYFTDIVSSYAYEDLMLLYSIVMGMPIEIHMICGDTMDSTLDRALDDLMENMSPEQYEELLAKIAETTGMDEDFDEECGEYGF